MISCWLDYEIKVQRYQGRDIDGEISYSSAETLSAYIKQAETDSRGAQGVQRSTVTEIYTLEKLQIMDRVWLPSDYDGDGDLGRSSLEVQRTSTHRSRSGCETFYKAVL